MTFFQSAAVFQVGRDPGLTPGMVTNKGIKPGRFSAPLYHKDEGWPPPNISCSAEALAGLA
jgi:hypothetical protein